MFLWWMNLIMCHFFHSIRPFITSVSTITWCYHVWQRKWKRADTPPAILSTRSRAGWTSLSSWLCILPPSNGPMSATDTWSHQWYSFKSTAINNRNTSPYYIHKTQPPFCSKMGNFGQFYEGGCLMVQEALKALIFCCSS